MTTEFKCVGGKYARKFVAENRLDTEPFHPPIDKQAEKRPSVYICIGGNQWVPESKYENRDALQDQTTDS